jgi:dolichyl-phosphate-mannose-protein mannosyltransferase
MQKMNSWGVRPWASRRTFALAVFGGLVMRILIVALPGNELRAPWSGGGDSPVYATLARNVLEGRGYSYAGLPTAFRAPGYPLFLAGMMVLFGAHYVAAVRWLQFGVGLATVWLCARVSARLFGESAWRPALAIALVSPTLVFVTGELLTECIGAFFGALFIFFFVEDFSRPGLSSSAGLGCAVGLGSLFRFNMAGCGLIGLWAALRAQGGAPRWQRTGLLIVCSALPVSPWIVRNLIVFHGQVLYSTQSGASALGGIVAPQGRALAGESERFRRALGWALPEDLETNDGRRTQLPAEPELDRRAWSAARNLWARAGWRSIPLVLAKWARFWLSTEQIFWTGAFTLRQRVYRIAGVLIYWLLLAVAIVGWVRLRVKRPEIALALLLYAALVTVLHSPFMMITRYRVPFMDGMVAMLAGGGWLALRPPQREAVAGSRVAEGERPALWREKAQVD